MELEIRYQLHNMRRQALRKDPKSGLIAKRKKIEIASAADPFPKLVSRARITERTPRLRPSQKILSRNIEAPKRRTPGELASNKTGAQAVRLPVSEVTARWIASADAHKAIAFRDTTEKYTGPPAKVKRTAITKGKNDLSGQLMFARPEFSPDHDFAMSNPQAEYPTPSLGIKKRLPGMYRINPRHKAVPPKTKTPNGLNELRLATNQTPKAAVESIAIVSAISPV